MSVSYCSADPDVAVTTPARRKMPCSSRSFLMLRTCESRVCKSRSWRYFSLEPQINSNSFLTCLLTNGVCWIRRYWKDKKRFLFSLLQTMNKFMKWKYTQDLLQIDSKTRNGQILEVGFLGLHQQFSLSDMATGGPFQSTAGSRLQKHQQHVPKHKNNKVSSKQSVLNK